MDTKITITPKISPLAHEEIFGVNGTRFVFKGLKSNPDAIKSLGGCDIDWVSGLEGGLRDNLGKGPE